MTRCCVYTVLYGQDEPLPAQPVRASSGIDFIAFVGDPTIASDTWQLRHLPPLLPDDLPRSARYVKMHPHILLPEFDASLYVDCAVELRRRPEDIFETLLFGVTDTLACTRHRQRDSIADEAEAIAAWDLDDPSVCAEQLRAYARDGHTGSVPLMWHGFLLRFHNDSRVATFMETWFAHVMAFSRRDQLAFPHVAEKLGFPFHAHDFDTQDSEWHRWPIDPDKQRAPWRPIVIEPPIPPDGSIGRRLWDASIRLDVLGPAAVVRRGATRVATPEPWVAPSTLPAATVALRQLRASLRAKREALGAASAELAALKGEVETQAREIAALRDELDKATTRLANLQAQAASSAESLDEIHRSTSWRLTAPLRRCVDAMRGRPPVR